MWLNIFKERTIRKILRTDIRKLLGSSNTFLTSYRNIFDLLEDLKLINNMDFKHRVTPFTTVPMCRQNVSLLMFIEDENGQHPSNIKDVLREVFSEIVKLKKRLFWTDMTYDRRYERSRKNIIDIEAELNSMLRVISACTD